MMDGATAMQSAAASPRSRLVAPSRSAVSQGGGARVVAVSKVAISTRETRQHHNSLHDWTTGIKEALEADYQARRGWLSSRIAERERCKGL